MALSVCSYAQLAWDTEFSKNDYNNDKTVISKSENVSFSEPTLGLFGGGLKIGKIVITLPLIGGDPYNDECVIALPEVGVADSLFFAWQGGSDGTVMVYQSKNHNNWSSVYTHEGNTISTDTKVSVPLSTDTRYLKFAATGKSAVTYRSIKVTELRSISAGTDEWPFGQAMVDDAESTKDVKITWTNIVATVSSTDPHFSASLTTIGEKNKINQTTQLTIKYSHSEAGKHSGEIVIAGEGREARIAVSGETKKYDQTLTWAQDLGEYSVNDKVTLNAYTTSGLDVVYETSDDRIAYVEGNTVQIVCAGVVTITATQPGNYKYNAANTVAKTLTVKKADPIIGVMVDDLTYGQKLSEAVFRETVGQVPGSFIWAGIDAQSVLDAGEYNLYLLFTPEDECVYNQRTLPVSIRINKAEQVIVWDDQVTDLIVGAPVRSTAVLSSGLPITYAFTECLLSIEDDMIRPENEGEVTVVAYHPGNNNYLPTTVIMTVFNISPDPNVTTDAEQLTPQQLRAAQKYVHEGKVFVSHNGHIYDADGKRMK